MIITLQFNHNFRALVQYERISQTDSSRYLFNQCKLWICENGKILTKNTYLQTFGQNMFHGIGP